MKKTKYDISVIIPVYNTEQWVASTLDSVLNQDYDISKIQLVVVNDGSTDNSEEIIKPYLAEYKNILYVKKENEGLSKTRNCALGLCEGRYILFLDSDDTISKDTVSSIVPFFDEHYDEIDLVSYKIIPVINGKKKKKKLHYRYEYLNETGVYDLTKNNNWFASITTMNYCVKNKFKKNILFDTSPNFFHEDQKYSMDIIKDKMKIGYVNSGRYYYLQQSNSITKTKFHAYYLFETTMKFWEDFFNQFEIVPKYYQTLLLNDLNWKNKAGILMPYQFEGKEFDQAFGRIKNLLSKVDDDVILNHPGVNAYHRFYWLNIKDDNKVKKEVFTNKNAVAILKDKKIIYVAGRIEADLIKFRIENHKIKMLFCLKSPVFMYDDEMPKVIVAFDKNNKLTQEFPVHETSYSYFQCKEKCTRFFSTEIEIEYEDIKMFKIYVSVHDDLIACRYVFPSDTVFSDTLKRYQYLKNGYVFAYSKKKDYFTVKEATHKRIKNVRAKRFKYYYNKSKRILLNRILIQLYQPKQPIWLYYDCKGVKKDNGYYQFIHDLEINDGIKRYYVTNNDWNFNKDILANIPKKNIIQFGSLKHKLVYCKASKIITAYIEQENLSPFKGNKYNHYIDIASQPEVIYLQHGILHAHMPWKYSYDRLKLDKEVISTYYEKENLINNYYFTSKHLIASGMPRYDYLNSNSKKTNTILYAPSWRSYLVGKQVTDYERKDNTFLESEYYIESKKFLESKELADMLEKYDYILNFKLHPILKKYKDLYNIANERIKIDADLPDDEYKIFITDFSSYVFDFIYLKRAIIYFVPDYIKFKSGMNLYREVDFKFEDGVGDFTQTSTETLKALQKLLDNNGEPLKENKAKMNKFFIHYDNNQCDRLYKALIGKNK